MAPKKKPAAADTNDTAPRARGRRPPARPGWEESFLAAFAQCGVVSYAAAAAGVNRSTVYEHRKRDEGFQAAFVEAEEMAADVLERAAFERAVEGWAEPVYHSGKLVGAVRRYSDRMLEVLLKARRPEKFRMRYEVEHGGSLGITLGRLHELADAAADGEGEE